MNSNERNKRAELYETYLRQYDERARKVSLIKSKFDLSKQDETEIRSLEKEMAELQRKAFSLGDYHG
jgi:septal ring factor EnvC (AmiA/AmiB activator)